MADRFPWQESYTIGIPEIDSQHQQFLGLLNALHLAMVNGDGQDVIEKTVNELTDYSFIHFRDEESLMLSCGYPDYSEHKRIHDDFQAKILELYVEVFEGKTPLTNEILSLMVTWLANHILHDDKLIALHVARCKAA